MFITRKCDAKEHRCDGIESRVMSRSLVHKVSEKRLI